MSSFFDAAMIVLKHEGKLVNTPDDPGGITNYGISLRYLSDLVQQDTALAPTIELDGKETVDAYDVQNMTAAEATKKNGGISINMVV